MLLFRMEDSKGLDGVPRIDCKEINDLPLIYKYELNNFIADEIRKEVNGAQGRRVLSYSKSLGVCLLKYNKYTENEIYIKHLNYSIVDSVEYYDIKIGKKRSKPYNLRSVINEFHTQKNTQFLCVNNQETTPIKVINFAIDVSNNDLLDDYLRLFTKANTGLKRFASPKKDKEVILYQSTDDYVIKNFQESVYLLYTLVYKYGMKDEIYKDIKYAIKNTHMESENEKKGLEYLVDYMYLNKKWERETEIENNLIKGSLNCHPRFYDPIAQLYEIQQSSFSEVYEFRNYNSNPLSDHIWEIYARNCLRSQYYF